MRIKYKLNGIKELFCSKNFTRKLFIICLIVFDVNFFMLGFQSAENRYAAFSSPVFAEVDDTESGRQRNGQSEDAGIGGNNTGDNGQDVAGEEPSGNETDETGFIPAETDNSELVPSGEESDPTGGIDSSNGQADDFEIEEKDGPEYETGNEGEYKTEKKNEIVYPVNWGNREEKTVFLTFDDGYDKKAVEKVLDTFKEKDIKGTFFVVGQYLTYFPDLWKRAVEEGHMICNHTYSHKLLNSLSEEEIRKEITQWEKTVTDILGEEYFKTMKRDYPYMRLPGGSGSQNKKVLSIVSEYGYKPIGWSLETYDSIIKHHNINVEPTEPIIDKIVNHVVNNSRNGTIILLHFNFLDTPKLEDMIDGLLEKGFTIGNLGSIFKND